MSSFYSFWEQNLIWFSLLFSVIGIIFISLIRPNYDKFVIAAWAVILFFCYPIVLFVIAMLLINFLVKKFKSL